MTVSELGVILQNLEKEGKGTYAVRDEGYLNIIEVEMIEIDDKWKAIIL